MPWKHFASKFSGDSDPTGLSESQKTALIAAWSLISPNLYDLSMNIFAKFYDSNPEYLSLFYALGNDVMHQHTEDVLLMFTDIIDKGLRDPEVFNESLKQVQNSHRRISRDDVRKLHQVIKKFFLEQIAPHKTKTLEDAIDILMTKIELRFEDSSLVNNAELWKKKHKNRQVLFVFR